MNKILLGLYLLFVSFALSATVDDRSEAGLDILDTAKGSVVCKTEDKANTLLGSYLRLSSEMDCQKIKNISEHCSCISKFSSKKLSPTENYAMTIELGYLGSYSSSARLQILEDIQNINGLYGEYDKWGEPTACIEEDDMNEFMKDAENKFKDSVKKGRDSLGFIRKDFFKQAMSLSKVNSLSEDKKKADQRLISDISKYIAKEEKNIEMKMSDEELVERQISPPKAGYFGGDEFVNGSTFLDLSRSEATQRFLDDKSTDFKKYMGSPLLKTMSVSSPKSKKDLINYLSRVSSHSGLVDRYKTDQFVDDSMVRNGVKDAQKVLPLYMYLPGECERIKEQFKRFSASNYSANQFYDEMNIQNQNLSGFKGQNLMSILDSFDPSSETSKKDLSKLESIRQNFSKNLQSNLAILDDEEARRVSSEKEFNLSRLICAKVKDELVKTALIKKINTSDAKTVDELYRAIGNAQKEYKKATESIEELNTLEVSIAYEEAAAIADLKTAKELESNTRSGLNKLSQLMASKTEEEIEKGNYKNVFLLMQEALQSSIGKREKAEFNLSDIRKRLAEAKTRKENLSEKQTEITEKIQTRLSFPVGIDKSKETELGPFQFKKIYNGLPDPNKDYMKLYDKDFVATFLKTTTVKEYASSPYTIPSKFQKFAEENRRVVKRLEASETSITDIVVKAGVVSRSTAKKELEVSAAKVVVIAKEAVDSGNEKRNKISASGGDVEAQDKKQAAVEESVSQTGVGIAKAVEVSDQRSAGVAKETIRVALGTLKRSETPIAHDEEAVGVASSDDDSSNNVASTGVLNQLTEISNEWGDTSSHAKKAKQYIDQALDVSSHIDVADVIMEVADDNIIEDFGKSYKHSQKSSPSATPKITDAELLEALDRAGVEQPRKVTSASSSSYKQTAEEKVKSKKLKSEISGLKAMRNQKYMEKEGLNKDTSRIAQNIPAAYNQGKPYEQSNALSNTSAPAETSRPSVQEELAQKRESVKEKIVEKVQPEEVKSQVRTATNAPSALEESKELTRKVKEQVKQAKVKRTKAKSSVTGSMTHDGKSKVAAVSSGAASTAVSGAIKSKRSVASVKSKNDFVTPKKSTSKANDFDFSSESPMGLSSKSFEVMPILDTIDDSYNRLPSFDAPENFSELTEGQQGDWVKDKIKTSGAVEVVIILIDGKKILVKKKNDDA